MKEIYFTLTGTNHWYGQDFLKKGMKEFLSAIDKKGLSDTLLDFTEWHKIVPISADEKAKRINQCKYFDFLEIDVFNPNR